MIGVDIDGLSQIINGVNGYTDDLRSEIGKIQNTTELLADLFRKNDMGNISGNLSSINRGYQNILNVTEGYIEVLEGVKKGYLEQEQQVSSTIKSVSTNIER